MSTLLKSLFPAALCVATVLIVSTHLLRDTGLPMPEWHLHHEAPVDVTLAEAAHHDLIHTVEATGKVEAEVEVKISAEVSGRIATLPIHEGDHVRKDQLLLQLDLALFEADVRSAQAKCQKLKESIVMDEADVEKAQRDMERNQKLVVGRAVDEATALDSVTTFKKNKAHLNMTKQELLDAESALAKAKEDLRKATIHSSLDGVVSSLSAKQGEVVLVGTMNNPGTVIMTLSEPGSLVARVRIDETKIPFVREGQKARIHLPNNEHLKLTGTVKHISPKGSKAGALAGAASSATGSSDVTAFETLIQLDSPPPEVRMEMTVNVEILVDHREGVLTVPAQSVLNRRPKDLPRSLREVAEKESRKAAAGPDSSHRYCQVVFVESEGVAHCRLVKTGIGDRGQVEILEGVKPGERVITGPYRNFDKLHDGTPVAELTESDDPDRGP